LSVLRSDLERAPRGGGAPLAAPRIPVAKYESCPSKPHLSPSQEDATKCLKFLRDKEGREFNLAKAKTALDSIKADHQKWSPQIPFKRPTRYPGFLLILERSSDKTA
jgi:hypothetical protein